MPSVVRDNPGLSRFELDSNGVTAVANYTLTDGIVTLTHTEVPERARHGGIASRLVAGALEIVRVRGLKVVPRCAFVRAFMDKHPEFDDLRAQPR
jgi:uncharacterized protein